MLKKIFLLLPLVLILRLITVQPAFAKRLLPHLTKTSSGTVKTSGSGRVATSVKFRGDRLATIISFKNLSVASKVDYFLTYNTRGTTQGASGTLIPAGEATALRELLFGTCSKGVCRYDTGITNAKLTITSTLGSGLKIIKRYRLKV
jgi:hypothetical protein